MPDWLNWLHSYIHDSFTVSMPGVTELYFASNIVYMLFVVIAFVYLFYTRKTNRNGYNLLFAFSVLTMLLIIYNPFLHLVFFLLPSTSDAVFARFWLLCPIWLITAFAIVSFVFGFNSNSKKTTSLIALAVVFVLFGDSLYSLSMMNYFDNAFKIRTESVELADGLMRLREGNPVKLLIMLPNDGNNGKFENGGSISEGIAQYNGYIEVYSYFYTDEEWNNYYKAETIPETGETSTYYINRSLMHKFLKYRFDYVAWPADDLIDQKLEQGGYSLLGEYGGYNVFAYVIDNRAVLIADSILESSDKQSTPVLLLSLEDQTNVSIGIRYYTD